MRITFQEALSLSRATDTGETTFIFTGKKYNYPAAYLFSKYLERITGKAIEFHEEVGLVLPGNINLFQTQNREDLDAFLCTSTGTIRVIPFGVNIYTKKVKWSRLVEHCVIVDVKTPALKTISNEITLACKLLGIPYDDEGVNAAVRNVSGGWSGILNVVEQAQLFKKGLLGKDSVLVNNLVEDKGYMGFKDSFLFGLPRDTADLFLKSDKYLEFANRLVEDMSVNYGILQHDIKKVSISEIALEYGVNEWFLRNRLLPRLRSMGSIRMLNFIEKVSTLLGMIMRAESPDPKTQLASLIMLLVCV